MSTQPSPTRSNSSSSVTHPDSLKLYTNSIYITNSTFRTEEGQLIYKVESSFGIAMRPINILRVDPPKAGFLESEELEDEALRDNLSTLADIEYREPLPGSKLKFSDRDEAVSMDGLFKKRGRSFRGSNRVFTGPDGKEYEWRMGATTCKLYTMQPSETLVAKFHLKHFGVFHTARKGYLEIFPCGRHMVDLIFVTFVFVEKMRKDRER